MSLHAKRFFGNLTHPIKALFIKNKNILQKGVDIISVKIYYILRLKLRGLNYENTF